MLTFEHLDGACSSLVAFACWLCAALVLILATPLNTLSRAMTFLCVGLYMATTFPLAYFALGSAIALDIAAPWMVVQLSSMSATATAMHFTYENALSDAALTKALRKPLENRFHVALLLFWYPASFSWTSIVRLQFLFFILFGCHLLILSRALHIHPRPDNVISLWVSVVDLLDMNWATVNRANFLFLFTILVFATPTWMLVLALIIMCLFLTGLVILDPQILSSDLRALITTLSYLLPDLSVVEESLAPMIWAWTEPLRGLKSQLQRMDQQRSSRHVVIGFILGLLLLFTSCFFKPLGLAVFAGVCAVSSPYPRAENIGFSSCRMLGLVLCLSCQGLCSGYVLAFYLTSPLQWLKLISTSLVLSLLCWLALACIAGQVWLYSQDLAARRLLFGLWAVKKRSQARGANRLDLVNDPSTILAQVLEQVRPDGSDFEVRFKGEKGLVSPQLATMLGRALVRPSTEHMAPFRTWEDGAGVYDVNYETKYMDVDDLLGHFRQLGVVFGKCLLANMHLLPLSKALCKCLLAAEGDDLPSKITFDDMVELTPAKVQMKADDPDVRLALPYDELQLHAVSLPDMRYSMPTHFTDADFHPPAEPTDAQFNQLAAAFVCNNYAQDLREAFREGFRMVVDCKISRVFSAEELQARLRGSCTVELNDWQSNTVYQAGASRDHAVVKLFWAAMAALSQSQMQSFCEFVTGQPTPPLGGFGALNPLFNITLNAASDVLHAHACANSVELPAGVTTEESMALLIRTEVNERFNAA